MFAEIESKARGLRRRVSRSEWAIKHLGLTPSEGTSEQAGLLLIQIDGFSRTQFERAVKRGNMPFLRRLLRREGYETHSFYPGLPSTTPAVQAELYYGIRSAVPAFSFYDRAKKQIGRMFYPEWAKSFEASYAEKNEGLLKGGSCWSNIYTGGAGQQESHFCAASIGFGDMWRTGKIRNIFVFIVLNVLAALRIAGLLIVELFLALWDVIAGVARGEKLKLELMFAMSRLFIGIGLRELVTIGAKVDVTRGLPIVHVNFLGYDEQAHRRGPGSAYAHWTLRGIDRAIKNLYHAANRSSRRDYTVWIFSDHGQERARSFALEFPGGIEGAVRECLELSMRKDPAWRARSQLRTPPAWLSRSRISQRRFERQVAAEMLTEEEMKTFTVTAIGPVGHVYFTQAMTDEQRRALARRLVDRGHVPGVLVRAEDGKIVWFHSRGETSVPDGVAEILPHPEPWRAEIARDLEVFCQNLHAGDLILFGWSPWEQPWSFAPERGAHGGPGLEETRGFVLLPARTRLPAGTEHFIRPNALRLAALHHLGREPMEENLVVSQPETRLRLMTYNTHGCGGMDGRVSPRRVSRVIAAHAPDLVALQEIDLGRRRSRAEDQAAIIAKQLGMHVVFCPTVTRNDEHYGHALLSRWPIEIVKRARLPHDPSGWWHEARSALWARVFIGDLVINVITTHLGLGPYERVLQMRMLLGSGWIGGIPREEPVILCGDFNLTPGTTAYGMAAKRLRDVQAARGGHRPISTFTSGRPFMRIDHIFVSKHFETKHVFVPRNELTRLASDHLPLVADLEVAPAIAEMPTHRSA